MVEEAMRQQLLGIDEYPVDKEPIFSGTANVFPVLLPAIKAQRIMWHGQAYFVYN